MNTVNELFAANTRHDGDHILWTGSISRTGRPALYYQGRTYSPRRIAWRLAHGAEPAGIVRATCNQPLCVAHIEDTAARQRTHYTMRTVIGYDDAPDHCRNDHPRDEHGRIDGNGVAYCVECQRHSKRRSRARAARQAA